MTSFARFRGRLARAAGITLLSAPVVSACTNEVVVEDGDGSGAGGAGASSGSNGNGSASQGSNGSGATGTTSSGTVTTGGTSGQGGATTTATGAGGSTMTTIACFPANMAPCASLASAPSVYGSCTPDDFMWIEQWIDGPFFMNGECCYEVVAPTYCGEGRPYTDHDRALVAAPSRSAQWLDGACDAVAYDVVAYDAVNGLSADARARLAAAWTRAGLFEHASVASFARFALELLAVGAPPELIAEAHRAALDEVRHAGMCFSLATRYGGEPVGPGALPMASEAVRADLAAIAAACAREGCIGETLAALVAAEQLRACSDPVARRMLETIAEDEARHAELAWRVVAWALETGDERVRESVSEAFAEAGRYLTSASDDGGDDALAAHGLLSDARSRRVQLRALTDVVMPCATALLRG